VRIIVERAAGGDMAKTTVSACRRRLLSAALAACVFPMAAKDAFGTSGASEGLIIKAVPSTGERLPVIGLGTDAFYRAEKSAIEAEIGRMVQLGGSVIDTASDYGDSESLIGDALATLGLRRRTFLATKLTAGGEGVFGIGSDLGGEQSFQRSLRRLRTEHIDLLQVHNLDGVDRLMPLMQRWKQAGQIRYIGVTVSVQWQHDELVQTMRRYPLDFIQVDYSISNRDAERAIFPTALERKVAVLVDLPLGRASLIREAQGHPLPQWAADLGISSWSQLFLKYVVSHPAVTCAIPGSTKLTHLEDNQAAARGLLPDAGARERMERYWRDVVA
jgi:aryl-alcohol dehydrogenase-like predicted oxidoreductase